MCNQKTIFIMTVWLHMVSSLKQDLTCFSSAHPAAQGLTKVFDLLNDEDNLWEKSSRPDCSVTIPTSFSHCCPDIQRSISPQVVYLFCHNLTGAELLKMEGPEGPVPFNKTDCPTPPPATDPAEDQSGHLGSTKENLKTVLYVLLVVFIILIFLVCIIIRAGTIMKNQRSSNQNHGSERGPGESGTNSTPLLHIENETETSDGHCGTETVNGHCGTETVNGHCGTETVNGHCGTET